MDTDKVIQDLNRRFAEPLPEFYKRRIIFWLDEDREFEDKLNEIELVNAELIVLTGSNTFEVKKLLAVDDTTSNFVVYRPFAIDTPDDNWLLNIELYSEEFRSDLLSIWMDEMHIPSTTSLRKSVKAYRKFFNAKERRNKVANLTMKKPITKVTDMHIIVMSVICGLSDVNNTSIIKRVLINGLNIDTNSIYADIENFGAKDAFWELVRQSFGYSEEEQDFGRLAAHILLTTASRTMAKESLAGLERFISTSDVNRTRCFDFVSDWLHSEDTLELYEIARFVEDELRLPQRFSKLSVEAMSYTECFPCINECILIKLMKEISDNIIEVDTITSAVEKRRACVWYDKVSYFFDGVLQVANMQEFYKEHSGGFHTVEPKQIWKEYVETYYKMDTFYRLFHLSFAQSLKSSNHELDDLFKHVCEVVEGLYTNWFLGELGNNWSDACANNLKEFGSILEVTKQSNFYKEKIKNADSRIFVIISDAMRYEVGATLCEQLKRETQAKVDIKSMQAIFPTITKFGMAALLPHSELSVEMRNNKLSVLADSGLTESNYRDKILKSENAESVALQYKNIVKMKRAERSELVKGKEVVYIYHDTIDESSHTSDSAVFPACDDAISEIKNLIKIIANDFGGVNIVITADHGFLYTYSPLSEDNKVDKISFNNKDIEYGRRYAILENDATPDYLMPIKLLEGASNYSAFAPRESIRIKMSGGGQNFVHGGISLQEMVVPVIEYRFLRNVSKEYKRNKNKYDTKPVTVNLLSANKKISNMIFSLNFYQKDAVSDNREAANYLLYFIDSTGKQISDVQKIIADKTSDNSTDRTFRLSFNLKSQSYENTEIYYLMISEESGLVLPQREEFKIDIAFAVDEFDFFS